MLQLLHWLYRRGAVLQMRQRRLTSELGLLDAEYYILERTSSSGLGDDPHSYSPDVTAGTLYLR
jgi:hypothetical protein